jgi:hypothetical protein
MTNRQTTILIIAVVLLLNVILWKLGAPSRWDYAVDAWNWLTR